MSNASRASVTQAVERALASQVKRGSTLCVALSGGMDSMVLLEVLSNLAPRHGWRLRALHVNHQLSAHATQWAALCRRACRERKVPLSVVRVHVVRGNSTEAAARKARYAAYHASGAEYMLLAHHQDDQAETLLLRLLRGAGVKGLAAMAPARREGALTLLRPLLNVPRSHIEAYAGRRQLSWVADESNADTHYLRNHLRAEVLPRIGHAVPAYRDTLARAAVNLGDAARLLDDLARLDAGGDWVHESLPLAAFGPLNATRRANLLRAFLQSRGVLMPDRRVLDEILRQMHLARTDSRLRVGIGAHQLRVYAGALYVTSNAPALPLGFHVPWQGEKHIALPALGGVLRLPKCRSKGIDYVRLTAEMAQIRTRMGGERLQPDARRPRRRVKDLLQEQGIPPWQRERLPFLWCGGQLAWVAGLGVDAAFQTAKGCTGVLPRWETNEHDVKD